MACTVGAWALGRVAVGGAVIRRVVGALAVGPTAGLGFRACGRGTIRAQPLGHSAVVDRAIAGRHIIAIAVPHTAGLKDRARRRRTIRAHAQGVAPRTPALVKRHIAASAVGEAAGLGRAGMACTVGALALGRAAVGGAVIRCPVGAPAVGPTARLGFRACRRGTVGARALGDSTVVVRAFAWWQIAAAVPRNTAGFCLLSPDRGRGCQDYHQRQWKTNPRHRDSPFLYNRPVRTRHRHHCTKLSDELRVPLQARNGESEIPSLSPPGAGFCPHETLPPPRIRSCGPIGMTPLIPEHRRILTKRVSFISRT